MAFDRFLIAPIKTGLQTDLRPWLIPDDAFQYMQNAYCFRGRVRKRFGSRYMGTGWSSPAVQQLFSRFSVLLNMQTDSSGDISISVPGTKYAPGQMFSIGNEIFTVYQNGTPAAMLTTGASTVYTYNTTTGAVVINGATPLTNVYFYPAQPVMGLTIYDSGPINNQPSYGFDTQFAYVFAGGFWSRSGTAIWHGGITNFFWAYNWQAITDDPPILFVSNFFAVNPMALVPRLMILYGTSMAPHGPPLAVQTASILCRADRWTGRSTANRTIYPDSTYHSTLQKQAGIAQHH